MSPDKIVSHTLLNGWPLFFQLGMLISLIMTVASLNLEQWNGVGVSSLVQMSVRCAVPFLYLAFAASSLQKLFPGTFSRWLLRNRRMLGLCFTLAMAWQLVYIVILVTVYRDYYIEEVYVLRDVIEGVTGYLFLAAMTLTSFKFLRKYIKPAYWRALHWTGIYFIWAYAFTTYWWELFYYSGPDFVDYLYFYAGFIAWSLRILAWYQLRCSMQGARFMRPCFQASARLLASSLLVGGFVSLVTASYWREQAETILTGYSFTALAENYLPYWPFEPFLPLLLLASGLYLLSGIQNNM